MDRGIAFHRKDDIALKIVCKPSQKVNLVQIKKENRDMRHETQ